MSPSSLERDLEVTIKKKKIVKLPAPCTAGVNLGTRQPRVLSYVLAHGEKPGASRSGPSILGPCQGQGGPLLSCGEMLMPRPK